MHAHYITSPLFCLWFLFFVHGIFKNVDAICLKIYLNSKCLFLVKRKPLYIQAQDFPHWFQHYGKGKPKVALSNGTSNTRTRGINTISLIFALSLLEKLKLSPGQRRKSYGVTRLKTGEEKKREVRQLSHHLLYVAHFYSVFDKLHFPAIWGKVQNENFSFKTAKPLSRLSTAELSGL